MKGTLLIAVALLIAAVVNAQAKSANVIERDSYLQKYPPDLKIDTQDLVSNKRFITKLLPQTSYSKQ